MAVEKLFVKEGIKAAEVESYLAQRFARAGYSHTEIQRTPLGTRIIVFAHKPGLVVGRSGRRISEITDEIKQKFGFENPLIDVKEVENPFLDAKIVAQRIANALERGINFKKVANYYLDKVIEAGAIGISIHVGGKLMGAERSRFQKFKRGFVAYSGDYAETLVDKGYAQGSVKPGTIGIQVRIMREAPKEFEFRKELKKENEKEVKEMIAGMKEASEKI
ncbi:MAG TPA: 30S ribosomal protein S3 [archaeon]|nr:30S ribosomal protein S3 [archaeon]